LEALARLATPADRRSVLGSCYSNEREVDRRGEVMKSRDGDVLKIELRDGDVLDRHGGNEM